METFPIEKYIDLENNPYLLGRLTVHEVKDSYHVEVDIIHKESHKIFKHIDIMYNQYGYEDALISGVQRLRRFLDSLQASSQSVDDLN